MNTDMIKTAYETKKFYAVVNNDGLYFIESPEEQGLTEEDTQESLLRLFISKEEATAYCDYVNAVVDGGQDVVSVELTDVWELLRDVDEYSMNMYQCTVRVVMCVLDEENWPTEVDTLHSVFMLPS